MKISIFLDRWSATAAMASIENGNGVKLDIAGGTGSTDKSACLEAAKKLREAAMRFEMLAEMDCPYNQNTHAYINTLKASSDAKGYKTQMCSIPFFHSRDSGCLIVSHSYEDVESQWFEGDEPIKQGLCVKTGCESRIMDAFPSKEALIEAVKKRYGIDLSKEWAGEDSHSFDVEIPEPQLTAFREVSSELIGEIEQHPMGLDQDGYIRKLIEKLTAAPVYENLEALVGVVEGRAMSDDAELALPLSNAKALLSSVMA